MSKITQITPIAHQMSTSLLPPPKTYNTSLVFRFGQIKPKPLPHVALSSPGSSHGEHCVDFAVHRKDTFWLCSFTTSTPKAMHRSSEANQLVGYELLRQFYDLVYIFIHFPISLLPVAQFEKKK